MLKTALKEIKQNEALVRAIGASIFAGVFFGIDAKMANERAKRISERLMNMDEQTSMIFKEWAESVKKKPELPEIEFWFKYLDKYLALNREIKLATGDKPVLFMENDEFARKVHDREVYHQYITQRSQSLSGKAVIKNFFKKNKEETSC